jgi:hypothetical protein
MIEIAFKKSNNQGVDDGWEVGCRKKRTSTQIGEKRISGSSEVGEAEITLRKEPSSEDEEWTKELFGRVGLLNRNENQTVAPSGL